MKIVINYHKTFEIKKQRREYKATLVIQKWIRKYRYRLNEILIDRDSKLSVSRAVEIFKTKWRCAIIIQKFIRMCQAKKKLRILKEAHSLVKNAVTRFDHMLECTKVIQKWIKAIYKKRNWAARVFQNCIVKFLARRRAKRRQLAKQLVANAV